MKKSFYIIAMLLMFISCSGNGGKVGSAAEEPIAKPVYTDLAYAMVQSATDELAAAESVEKVHEIEQRLAMDLVNFFLEHEKEMNENTDEAEIFVSRLDSMMAGFNSLAAEKKAAGFEIEQL